MFWDILGRRRQALQFNVIMVQRPQAITTALNYAQVVEEVLAVLQESLAPDYGKLAGLFDSDNGVQGIDFVRCHRGEGSRWTGSGKGLRQRLSETLVPMLMFC